MNKDGSGYTVLRAFSDTGSDGQNPVGLMEGSDGALYGTTSPGGIPNPSPYSRSGLGTVFKLNKDGSGYSVLRAFSAAGGGAMGRIRSLEWWRAGAGRSTERHGPVATQTILTRSALG